MSEVKLSPELKPLELKLKVMGDLYLYLKDRYNAETAAVIVNSVVLTETKLQEMWGKDGVG